MRLLKIVFIIFIGGLVFAIMTMTALAGSVMHASSALIDITDSKENQYIISNNWNGKNFDIRIFKYSPYGGIIWNRTYDTGLDETAYKAIVDKEDNLILVGSVGSGENTDFLVVKYSGYGELNYGRRYNVSAKDVASKICQGPEGSVYVAGNTFDGLDYDCWIARVGPSGALFWQQRYNSSHNDYPEKLFTLSSERVQLVIESVSGSGFTRRFILSDIRFDANGTRIP